MGDHQQVRVLWRNGKSTSQMGAAIVHAGDYSRSSTQCTRSGIVWPRISLSHGARIQRLAVRTHCDTMVQVVLRDQHLGGSDAAVCANLMVRDTLARLNDQHIPSTVKLDAARAGQTSRNLCSLPSSRKTALECRVASAGARGWDGSRRCWL